jgi:hypothetical protein
MPRRSPLPCAGVLVALGLVPLAGCGHGTYPVHGKLVYQDGQPARELAGYTVTFTSEKLGKSSVGVIKDDGTFVLGTDRREDGAVPGEYRVILTQPHPNDERRETMQPVVDPRYEEVDTSDLNATVEAKGNDFTFTLRRFKP